MFQKIALKSVCNHEKSVDTLLKVDGGDIFFCLENLAKKRCSQGDILYLFPAELQSEILHCKRSYFQPMFYRLFTSAPLRLFPFLFTGRTLSQQAAFLAVISLEPRFCLTVSSSSFKLKQINAWTADLAMKLHACSSPCSQVGFYLLQPPCMQQEKLSKRLKNPDRQILSLRGKGKNSIFYNKLLLSVGASHSFGCLTYGVDTD